MLPWAVYSQLRPFDMQGPHLGRSPSHLVFFSLQDWQAEMTFVFRGIAKSLVDLGADGLAGVAVGRGRSDLRAMEDEDGSIVAYAKGTD